MDFLILNDDLVPAYYDIKHTWTERTEPNPDYPPCLPPASSLLTLMKRTKTKCDPGLNGE